VTDQQFRVADQEYDPAIDLAAISEHPANPNQGDDGFVMTSLGHHGFFGAILVHRETRRIIAGHTRYRTARELGATTLPGFWWSGSEEEAEEILALDNEATRRGRNDESKLYELLTRAREREHGLERAGSSEGEYMDLAALLRGQDLTGVPTGAAWAETEEEQEARAGRIGSYADRKQSGALTEMILVVTPEARDETYRLVDAIKPLLGGDPRAADVILVGLRMAERVLTDPERYAALAQLAGENAGGSDG
jgi:hypothetical protein